MTDLLARMEGELGRPLIEMEILMLPKAQGMGLVKYLKIWIPTKFLEISMPRIRRMEEEAHGKMIDALMKLELPSGVEVEIKV